MSTLPEIARLVQQVTPYPSGILVQDDTLSKRQVVGNRSARPDPGPLTKPQEIPSSPNSDLDSKFVIKTNRQDTLRFIAVNGLGTPLLQSEEHIKTAFGESSLKTLALVEDDEGYRTLFCLVVFPGSLDRARQALKSFDNNWWLQRARRFGAKLNFDFELI